MVLRPDFSVDVGWEILVANCIVINISLSVREAFNSLLQILGIRTETTFI